MTATRTSEEKLCADKMQGRGGGSHTCVPSHARLRSRIRWKGSEQLQRVFHAGNVEIITDIYVPIEFEGGFVVHFSFILETLEVFASKCGAVSSRPP